MFFMKVSRGCFAHSAATFDRQCGFVKKEDYLKWRLFEREIFFSKRRLLVKKIIFQKGDNWKQIIFKKENVLKGNYFSKGRLFGRKCEHIRRKDLRLAAGALV